MRSSSPSEWALPLEPPLPREFRMWQLSNVYRKDPEGSDVSMARDTQERGVRAVGQPGKVGTLELELAPDPTGKTGMRHRYVKAPMSLSRPLHIDAQRPNHAYVYLRATGGGLAENDRITHHIKLRNNAAATITTQAATNVHRMDEGIATTWTRCELAPGSVLEYFPSHTTLFSGSRLAQCVDFHVDATATLFAAEITMLGRIARGECREFDAFAQSMRITRHYEQESDTPNVVGSSPRIILNDTLVATAHDADALHIFGHWPVWATAIFLPPVDRISDVPLFLKKLRSVAEQHKGWNLSSTTNLTWGISTLVDEEAILCRVAGMTVESVQRCISGMHNEARSFFLGATAIDMRRM